MDYQLQPDELMEGDEVVAQTGFPGRMWVPNREGKYLLMPLSVYPALPGSMANLQPVRLQIKRIFGDYAVASRLNDFCPPTFVWFDLREVPLYASDNEH